MKARAHYQSIIREAIDFQECGQQAVKRFLELPVIPLKEESYYDIFNQYTNYNFMSNTNPLYNYNYYLSNIEII